jgi:small GTP-binding protein
MESKSSRRAKRSKRRFDISVAICAVGNVGVGKTAMSQRYAHNTAFVEHSATVGVDLEVCYETVNNGQYICKALVHDTSGSERFYSVTKQIFQRCDGIMLCFDVTDRGSFEDLRRWAQSIADHATESTRVIIVANKTDLSKQRQVSKQEAEAYAKEQKLDYFELSAKTSSTADIRRAFVHLIELAATGVAAKEESGKHHGSNNNVTVSSANKPSSSSSCAC